MINIKEIAVSLKYVFSSRKYFVVLLFIFALLSISYYYVPVILIPGNDLFFQITLMKWYDHLALLTTSFLLSLLIVMHIYASFNKSRLQYKKSLASYFSGLISGFVSSLGCVSCSLSYFSFIPLTTAVFIYEYRIVLYIISFTIILIALYYTSLKVQGKCSTC